MWEHEGEEEKRDEWEYRHCRVFKIAIVFLALEYTCIPYHSFCLRLSRYDRVFPKSYANSWPKVSHSKNIANAHMKMKKSTINIPSFGA